MKNVEDLELFFAYLESEGLNPNQNKAILEVAPNILESQSRLLVEKYGTLFKQFLLSRNFHYNNAFNVVGAKGGLYVHNEKTYMDIPSSLESDAYFLETQKRSFFNRKGYKLPNIKEFDTLLIKGMPEEVCALCFTELNAMFGDVINTYDTKYKELYEKICKLMNKRSGYQYKLCKESISELDKELYLIKRK